MSEERRSASYGVLRFPDLSSRPPQGATAHCPPVVVSLTMLAASALRSVRRLRERSGVAAYAHLVRPLKPVRLPADTGGDQGGAVGVESETQRTLAARTQGLDLSAGARPPGTAGRKRGRPIATGEVLRHGWVSALLWTAAPRGTVARLPTAVARGAAEAVAPVAQRWDRVQEVPQGALVRGLVVVGWELQVGDPAEFAFSVAFTPNPDGEHDASSPDASASWGHFRLWVDGENLCAHHEMGEVVDTAHWYLLPMMEWFAENWNALFHEERLPVKNVGLSAAEGLAQSKNPPLSLKEVDEFDWLRRWGAWWSRHNLRAGREGGLFSDLYIRRYRHELEISTGAEPLPGIPYTCSFVARRRSYRVELERTSALLFAVLFAAANELQRSLPESQRILALQERLSGLADAEQHRLERLAYLSGFQEKPDAFAALTSAVDEAFSSVEETVRGHILGTRRENELVLLGTPYARLLYGALSPQMTPRCTDAIVSLAEYLSVGGSD